MSPLSYLSPYEDEKSAFFLLSDCHNVINIPIGIEKDPDDPDVSFLFNKSSL
jgi:hypothetical protein